MGQAQRYRPPAHAVVLSIDEKSQIQALDRTQPGLPMKKGRCGTMTHDYNVSANFGTRGGECLRLERNDALRRAWIVALMALFSRVSRCFGAERVQRS